MEVMFRPSCTGMQTSCDLTANFGVTVLHHFIPVICVFRNTRADLIQHIVKLAKSHAAFCVESQLTIDSQTVPANGPERLEAFTPEAVLQSGHWARLSVYASGAACM